jgi:hypothetical protein
VARSGRSIAVAGPTCVSGRRRSRPASPRRPGGVRRDAG